MRNRGPRQTIRCTLHRHGNTCPYGLFVCGKLPCLGHVRYRSGGPYAQRVPPVTRDEGKAIKQAEYYPADRPDLEHQQEDDE